MKRFWVSWYSGNYEDEGCTAPPFKFWVTGQIDRENNGLTPDLLAKYERITDEIEADKFLEQNSRDDCSICAVIDSENEDDVWELVLKHFPDYKPRFCEIRDSDFQPNNRFL